MNDIAVIATWMSMKNTVQFLKKYIGRKITKIIARINS